MTDRSLRQLMRRIAVLENAVRRQNAGPQLGYSSIENRGINTYDKDGVLGSRIGRQFDDSFTSASLNGPTPPQPSVPAVAAIPGGARVRWDGLYDYKYAVAPMDFSRVEVHVSDDPDFDAVFATTLLATIETPRGAEVTCWIPGADGATEFYARFVVRTQSGGISPQSDVSDPVVPGVGDVPIGDLEDRVDALETGKAPIDNPVFTTGIETPALKIPGSTIGQVWTAQDALGNGDWEDPSGGGGGGGANLSTVRDATTVTVASDSGTDATIPSADSSNAGVLTSADKVKLDGIASGATAVTSEQIMDVIAAMLAAGTGISLNYVDGSDTLTITCTVTSLTTEDVQDIVGAEVVGGTGIDATYNDGAGTVTLALQNEAVQDIVGALLAAGTGITVNYNDAGDVETISLDTATVDARYQAQEEPLDQGLFAVSFDSAVAGGTSNPVLGSVYLAKVFLAAPKTITNLHVMVETAGVTLTSGQCLAALYDSTGTQRGVTATQHTAWQSTGAKTMALTASYAAAAGFYWVAVLVNGTTAPAFLRSVAATNSQRANAFLAAAASRAGIAATSQTSMPASFTPSSINQTAHHLWVGVS